MSSKDPWAGYPTGWECWATRNNGYALSEFGVPSLPNTRKKLGRFGARYRAAVLYREAEFKSPEMTVRTAAGYSELLRLALMFAAAESFLVALAIDSRKSISLFSAVDRNTLLTAVRALDAGGRFFQGVYDILTRTSLARNDLEAYLRGADASPYLLAQAVRHAFLHGELTPNIASADPVNVRRIVRLLNVALKEMMDREFSDRIRKFEAKHPRPTPTDDADVPF